MYINSTNVTKKTVKETTFTENSMRKINTT